MIVAAAYGDETYVPGMPWNTGNCTIGLGVSAVFELQLVFMRCSLTVRPRFSLD